MTSLKDIVWILINGIQYDVITATAWAMAPFCFSAGCVFVDVSERANRFRLGWGEIYCVLYAGVCIITINYFKEYDNQFNHFIVNLIDDDTKAILQTIWSDYHVVDNFLIISVLVAGMVPILRIVLKTAKRSPNSSQNLTVPAWRKGLLPIIAIILVIVGILGNINNHASQNATLIKDEFLHKAVQNPFIAFYNTTKSFFTASTDAELDLFLPDHNVRRAAQIVFNNTGNYDDLDEYFIKIAPGSANHQPRHIFLIVMESYDAWPLMNKYASLHLTDNLKQIMHDGIAVQRFLPSGDQTIQSLSSLISGIPSAVADASFSTKQYPTFLALQFKRLGYRTNLFYGGDREWRNINKFALSQGFDNVYGANNMADKSLMNAWGVPDEYLFSFIINTVDNSQPSFNLVMTTSYHPPYSVDVYGKGFPLKNIPSDLVPIVNKDVNLVVYGHLWYSDRCLGKFVRSAEKQFTNTLFAITGDHFGRRHISTHPDFFEKSAVPFVLYGKDVLRGIYLPKDIAGSHIDIGPTLIELAAPSGFRYYAAGTSLLHADKNHIGIGRFKLIGPDFLVDLSDVPRVYPVPGYSLPKSLPDMNEMKLLFNRMYAIGWWRGVRGPKLP